MTFANRLRAITHACGGIPNTCNAHGMIVGIWNAEDDGTDRELIDVAIDQFTLRCAFAAFGDAVRRIAKQPAADAPRLDS